METLLKSIFSRMSDIFADLFTQNINNNLLIKLNKVFFYKKLITISNAHRTIHLVGYLCLKVLHVP